MKSNKFYNLIVQLQKEESDHSREDQFIRMALKQLLDGQHQEALNELGLTCAMVRCGFKPFADLIS